VVRGKGRTIGVNHGAEIGPSAGELTFGVKEGMLGRQSNPLAIRVKSLNP